MCNLLLDPLDFSAIYESRSTVLIAFSDDEVRQSNVQCLRGYGLDVFDAYRNIDSLLPHILKVPCLVRLMDYCTYQMVDSELEHYVRDKILDSLTPTIVYGVRGRLLLPNPSIIDATMIHPSMMSAFYRSITEKR